jgi:uncharacterized repeat protein (TIGR01451 family)
LKAKIATGFRCALFALVVGASAVAAGAAPLPPSAVNVELVSTFDPSPDQRAGGVASLGDFAYVGVAQTSCTSEGVRVIDLSDPGNPGEAAFIPAGANALVTGGLHVARISTAAFTGDVLAVSIGRCTSTSKGGFSLWDVTNPRAPSPLALNSADTSTPGGASFEHSTDGVFLWQQGANAYAVTVDIDEEASVDIFDITIPTAPVLIAETGAPAWPDTVQGELPFLADVQVRNIGGHWRMLLAYGDSGAVVLDVDNPAQPVFVDDSDFPDPDSVYAVSPSDGPTFDGEWDSTGTRIVTSDLDTSVARLRSKSLRITGGPYTGPYPAAEFPWSKQILRLSDAKVNGPTVYGGYGCDAVDQIPAADTALPPSSLAAGEEQIVVVQRGPVNDPSQPYAGCRFDEKAQNALDKGYEAIVIANHHAGAQNGASPDAPFCGSGDPRDIHMVCVGHRAMHLTFNDAPDYDADYTPNSEPAIGTVGERVEAIAEFEGWGYVRVLDASTLTELSAYAIPEAHDVNQAFAGSGNLSASEIATDPTRPYAYASWHAGGLRVLSFDGGALAEVGRFVGPGARDLAGVQVHTGTNGDRHVLATDSQGGLHVFRYGADLRLTMSGPAAATEGENLVYTLQLTNAGTTNAVNVSVNDPLPAGTSVVGATTSQGTCGMTLSGPAAVTCSLGMLPKGQTAEISITLRATAPGTITNTVSASTTEVDPSPRNDRASVQTTVAAAPSPPPPPPPGPPPPPPPAPPRTSPAKCRVPAVVGRKLSAARQRIRRAKCAVGRVRRVRSRRSAGVVISQTPRAGRTLRRGGRVNLVVSRGRR